MSNKNAKPGRSKKAAAPKTAAKNVTLPEKTRTAAAGDVATDKDNGDVTNGNNGDVTTGGNGDVSS
jgi:hypothetical protein